MRKTVSIVAAGVALVASSASAAPLERNYSAGMRIIHVPQPGEVAAVDRDEPVIVEDIEPPKPRKRAAVPRRVLPPANEQKRAVLNVPTDAALSPIRPTPRWRGIEKFGEPPKPVAAAPVPTDSVVATIPTDTVIQATEPSPQASDVPVIDDDAPPPAD